MPAPPEESEPAMVSAMGIVIVLRGSAAGHWQQVDLHAILNPARRLFGDSSDGSLLRPVQMQAWPVLRRRQRACGGRDRLGDLLHCRRLRSAGEILRR